MKNAKDLRADCPETQALLIALGTAWVVTVAKSWDEQESYFNALRDKIAASFAVPPVRAAALARLAIDAAYFSFTGRHLVADADLRLNGWEAFTH